MEGEQCSPQDRTWHPVTGYPGEGFPPRVPSTEPVGWALHLDSESVVPQTSSTCRLGTQLVSIHQDLGRTSTPQQDPWGLWEYLALTLLSPWSHPSEIGREGFYFLPLLWTFSPLLLSKLLFILQNPMQRILPRRLPTSTPDIDLFSSLTLVCVCWVHRNDLGTFPQLLLGPSLLWR